VLVPAGPWLSDRNGTSIFVLSGDGSKAARRPVTIGRRNPEYAEVLGGLKPGEHVVTGARPPRQSATPAHNKSTQP